MNESLNNLATIRQYLLGRVSDEPALEGIEELLFADEDFCTKVEIVEDELINDFVFGKLSAEDNLSFEQTLENNSDRRAKVKVTQLLKETIATEKVEEKVTFFDSIKAFFRQPIYAGGFALLLIAILIGAILFSRSPNNPELAELKNIYQKNRPIESRISEFDYAPYEITRGENDLSDAEKRKLRLVETKLLESVDKNPNAENHHALGVFYLTQAKYADSIKELEQSVKLNDKNAEFHNSLGSAYFELGKFEKENKLLNVAKANESFSKSLELNPNFLEALFNKSLTLQTLNLPRQAKESWELYLQKDSTSKWADEARKNLEKIAQMQSSFKTKEQVLEDFLTAYRQGDEEFAWKINCQTKEMISGVWLPDQLSRRYLVARKNKDGRTAKESIEALTYIGKLEHDRNADFFVRDFAEYYKNVGDGKIDDLLKAKELLSEGYKSVKEVNYLEAQKRFIESKELFFNCGNDLESKYAEFWLAQCFPRSAELVSANEMLKTLLIYFEKNNFLLLKSHTIEWLSTTAYFNNDITKSINFSKESLQISKGISDLLGQQKFSQSIGDSYSRIGETYKPLEYIGQKREISNLYFESQTNLWRDYTSLARAYINLRMFNTSYDFANESLLLGNQILKNADVSNSSLNLLGNANIGKKDFEEALKNTEDSLEIINNRENSKLKTLNLAKATVKLADLNREIGQCDKALLSYDLALSYYFEIDEIKIGNYPIHKGKLICYEKLNRRHDFEKELLIVLDLVEKFRNEISEQESRNSFFETEQNISNLITNDFLNQNNPRKAFEVLENSKARSLLDLIENKGFYDDKEKQIVFKESAQPFSVEQIQTQLSPNVQLIQYAVLEDKIAVWLISNNQFEVVITQIQADLLEQKVKDYLDLIKEKSLQTKQISKELFDILLKPILAKLDKSKQICIVPDGILYHLPFASLVSSETEKYLIEDFTLFYSPSATTSIILSEKANSKAKAENLLVIGNPEFNRSNNSTLQNLESAEKEATEISKFYEKPTKLIKSQATKSEVLANFSKANVFHFAGHYVANPNSSLNSKLLLTQPTNSKDEFEGELRASEILQLKKANLKLAVLSACETGIERYYKGEGAIGMARTFLAVGTPIVVASQWKVESESTSELMKMFHRNRKEKGLIPSEALRQAQLEMIAKKEFSEPYFWSSFSAVGGNVNY